jgi:hypothetical protein
VSHSKFRVWAVALLLAAAFVAAHLPFPPASLEDIDSINFALGIRDFDVVRHQPHPPGYPVLIALGKGATAVARALGSTVQFPEARGLAWLGAIFGGLAVFPLVRLFRGLGLSTGNAIGATALTICSPLYWFTAGRPLSDVVGLAFTISAQALLVTAAVRQGSWADDRAIATRGGTNREAILQSGRLIVLGSLVAGFAAGVRSQTLLLTLPLLSTVVLDRIGRGAGAALVGSLVAFVTGVLLWLGPMLAITGPSQYVGALSWQAGDDWAGVDMLASHPVVGHFMHGGLETFIHPWVALPLAIVVIGLAVLGTAAMLRESRRALLFLAAASLPYALFHFTFQEMQTIRYALPLVPPIALLAVRGLAIGGMRLAALGAAALSVASLLLVWPLTADYSKGGGSIFDLLASMRARAKATGVDAPVVMHQRIYNETRRVRQTMPDTFVWPIKRPIAGHEWLQLTRLWRGGHRGPVWMLADPARTDLALVDRRDVTRLAEHRWPGDTSLLMGGVRPNAIDWLEIRRPRWFLDQGWSLTPETAGVARRDNKGPALGGITAHVRLDAAPLTLLIGGRHLGAAGSTPIRFRARFGDRWDRQWVVKPGFFLETWRLETEDVRLLAANASSPEGYVRLLVTADPTDGGRGPAPAAIEQFDVASDRSPMLGFADGWQEAEYNPARGRSWRWMADTASLRVLNAPEGIRLRLAGESPLEYFDAPPTVVIRAGTTELARHRPDADFDWTVTVPREALAKAGGTVTVATDRVYVPDEVERNGDRRRLGLRLFRVEIAGSPPSAALAAARRSPAAR